MASDPPSATTEPSPEPMSFDIQRKPVPVGVGRCSYPGCAALVHVVEREASPRKGPVPPAAPPIRSVFQSGMRCSTVLMTVLASMRARAAPRQKRTGDRRRHGGPSQRRRGPCAIGTTVRKRFGLDLDRTRPVIVRMTSRGRRAFSRRRPCYRRTRHPARRCSPRWCGYRGSHG